MNKVLAAAVMAAVLFGASACDDKSENKSGHDADSAQTSSISPAQSLTASLTDDLNSEMQALGSGGSSSNIELTSYLGAVGAENGYSIETPDWSHPVDIVYSEFGGSRITAEDPPAPTVILYVKLHTDRREHSFAYIGHFTEKGIVFRHEVLDLDPGSNVIAEWKKLWFFTRAISAAPSSP